MGVVKIISRILEKGVFLLILNPRKNIGNLELRERDRESCAYLLYFSGEDAKHKK